MRNPKVFAGVTVALLIGVTVAACGSGTGVPNPSRSSPTSWSACAQFVPEAPCGKYASTAGSDDGTPIPWVTAGEVTAQLSERGGDTYLTVVTPCAPLDAVVTFTGNVMRLTGQRALGAAGCGTTTGEQQTWVLNFLEETLELGYRNNTLTWTNGKDSLSFVVR